MHTVLGSTGVIGTELARALVAHTSRIRLVSRSPRKINDSDELFSADLTDPVQTDAAMAGTEVAYLTIGLPYKHKVWVETWPLIMKNVLSVCRKHQAKLVFFDNVYPYGKVAGWMTETTPVNPISKKGEVRAHIAAMMMDEVEKGRVDGLIARSADFYGLTPMSYLLPMVFEPLLKGKTASWMLNDQVRHSFTYTPDAGKATALLGHSPEAFGQIWHLPTDPEPLTGKEFIETAARALDVSPRYRVLPRWMLKVAGWFNPMVHETLEMLYQNRDAYLFDSQKFFDPFPLSATPYQQGIQEIAQQLRQQAPVSA